MIVTGESKVTILKKLLNKDSSIPASGLINHNNFTIVCDKEANPED